MLNHAFWLTSAGIVQFGEVKITRAVYTLQQIFAYY